MTSEDYRHIFDWYEDYTRPYLKDEKLKSMSQVKYAHTRRVVSEMEQLIEATKLDKNLWNTALAIALLHDTGRYEQYRIYGSMRDAITENHAELGISEIIKHKVLDFLPEDENKQIIAAINNHNRLKIENGLDAETEILCKLIRDADKLDILRVFVKNDFNEEDSETVFLDLEDTGEVNPEIPRQIINGNMVQFHMMKSHRDMYLSLCAWVFDLNFKQSREFFVERGYINKIALNLPDTQELRMAFKKINEVLKN